VLIVCIYIYRAAAPSFIRNSCRFMPTCSHYAEEALRTHGFWKGTLLTCLRLLRCQPFCRGGWDPVPPPGKQAITEDEFRRDRKTGLDK